MARARAAAKHAYVPYSEFPVGAAVLAADGSIHTGCNVENASYGLTICAERVAVSAAVSAGHRQIVAVAVSAPKVPRTTPCGACRQFLNEFRPATTDMVIILDDRDSGEPVWLEELLPRAFGPRNLDSAQPRRCELSDTARRPWRLNTSTTTRASPTACCRSCRVARSPSSSDSRASKGIVYRRHTGGSGDDTWIRIADRDSLLDWARQHAVGLHAHIRSEDRGAWFVIDIDSRVLPTEMAQRAAIHAADVLAEQGIDALVKFSGSDGFHLMWDVPDLDDLEDDALWELERAVVRAVACEVERRLADDPEASVIWDTVGAGKQAITTGSADRENPNALLFDEYILKDNANFRVPYSIHPATGLVAAPLSRSQLATFRPDRRVT